MKQKETQVQVPFTKPLHIDLGRMEATLEIFQKEWGGFLEKVPHLR